MTQAKEKSWKESEPNNKKITNKELQEQRMLDVNQLPVSAAPYRKLATSDIAVSAAVTEKLTVALEEKNLFTRQSSMESASKMEASACAARYLPTTTSASIHHHMSKEPVEDRSSDRVVSPTHRCSGHPGPPPVAAHRVRAYSSRRTDRHTDDDACTSQFHESSRLLSCCHDDACSCDHSRIACSRTSPKNNSDSEEEAMFVSRHRSSREYHCHQCRLHRPASQQFDGGHRYRQRHRLNDAYYSETDRVTPVRHTRSTAEDPDLPPYESVVSGSSQMTSPSSDCSRHQVSTSGLYHQSPPPSYSHHSSRNSQSLTNRDSSLRLETQTPLNYSAFCSPHSGDSDHIDSSQTLSNSDRLRTDRLSASLPGDDLTSELVPDKTRHAVV